MTEKASPFVPFEASAPGKVILSGEHAVVHGTHAVATVVGKRAFAEFRPSGNDNEVSVTVTYHTKQIKRTWNLDALRTFSESLTAAYKEKHANVPSDWNDPTVKLASYTDLFHTSFSQVPHATVRQSVEVEDGSGEAKSEPVQSDIAAKLDKAPALIFLMMYVLRFQCALPLAVRIRSDLPMGAGLGSSAAVCSALAAGFAVLDRQRAAVSAQTSSKRVTLTDDDKLNINRWAFEGERLMHGNPSGVDNTCAVYGGVIVYRRLPDGQDVQFLPAGCIPKTVRLVITDTKVPRDTKALVAKVGKLKDQHPVIMKHILNAFDSTAMGVVDAVKGYIKSVGLTDSTSSSTGSDQSSSEPSTTTSSDDQAAITFYKQFAELIPVNQGLLDSVGVGHPIIHRVIEASSSLHLPCKLTGAGGGGCVITIVPPSSFLTTSNPIISSSPSASGNAQDYIVSQLSDKVKTLGGECFETIIGQEGVIVSIL